MTLVMVVAMLALPVAALAEPSGGTVWSGRGSASTRGGDPEQPTHLSAMHFPNGRTVYTTMGPGELLGFGGAPPTQHGRDYLMHVDEVHVGKETFAANGTCEIKLRSDRSLRSVGCAAAAGGPDPSLHFDADHTPPDFTSFDKR